MTDRVEVLDTWSDKVQGGDDPWFDEYFNELCGGNFRPVINPPMEKTNGKTRRKNADNGND